jgi:hypothetical protein
VITKVLSSDGHPELRNEMISFYKENFPGEKKYISSLFNSFFSNNIKKTIILILDKDEILGALTVLHKSGKCQDINISICGMSYMVISKSYRKKIVVSKHIKNEFFKIASKFDICLGVARKAIDGYWSPYGFSCLSNFNQLTLSKDEFIVNTSASAYKGTLEEIISFAKLNQENSFLSIHRDDDQWQKSLNSEYLQIHTIGKDEKLIGIYTIYDNKIIEVICSEIHFKEVIDQISNSISGQDIIFQLNDTTLFSAYLKNYNHSISKRHPWNGAHIIKINSTINFLNKITPLLLSRVVKISLSDFEITIGNKTFKFCMNTLELTIQEDIEIDDLATRTWNTIIFGVLPANQIFKIANHPNIDLIMVLFPYIGFNLNELDQF